MWELLASLLQGAPGRMGSFDFPELCCMLGVSGKSHAKKAEEFKQREPQRIMDWSLAREHLTEQEPARCGVSKVNL